MAPGKRLWLLFFPAAALLLYHACGVMAPYRDTGEFVLAARFLNIAHPPGYPFYTLFARAWTELIPFGNIAYRLNILSALACAMAFPAGIFFLMRCYQVSFTAAFASMALFLFSNPVLGLSAVSEMYTLGLLLLIVILICAHKGVEEPRYWMLAALLAPLALGTRMDLALCGVYALPFLWTLTRSHSHTLKRYAACFLFLILGSFIFLYLPVRSSQQPLLNWGDPSTFVALWKSVTRASYGSSVDLLSRHYASGELFFEDLRFWFSCAWESFGPLLLLAPLGLWGLWKKGQFWPSVLAWIANVPLFLYMANLPLNAHAAKILQDHFMPGFLITAIWIGVGIHEAIKATEVRKFRFSSLVSIAFVAFVASVAFFRSFAWSFRSNFYAHDYARHLFLSAPKDALLVLHEDVQLFSAWEAQRVRGKRPDLRLISHGLSGTPWYQKSLKTRWGYSDIFLGYKLETPSAWQALLANNPGRRIMAGFETDVNASIERPPRGLVVELAGKGGDVWNLFTYRNSYHHDSENLFFNQDLVEDYARASDTQGWRLYRLGARDEAEKYFMRALNFKNTFPFASSGLGYIAFDKGDWANAWRHWQSSRRKFMQMLDWAKQYHSLPEVSQAINMDLAQNLTSLGVLAERLDKPVGESIALYQEAASRHPNYLQAHYNLAATYWKLRDGVNAKRAFEEVLRINPEHPDAKKYLSQLR